MKARKLLLIIGIIVSSLALLVSCYWDPEDDEPSKTTDPAKGLWFRFLYNDDFGHGYCSVEGEGEWIGTSLRIPLTSLSDDDTYNCSIIRINSLGYMDIEELYLPLANITYVAPDFARCQTNLEKIVVEYDKEEWEEEHVLDLIHDIDGVLFNGSTIHTFPKKRSGSYEIPTGTTRIEAFAFYNCANLTSITIPASVTSIGVSAFDSCSSLSSLTFEGTTAQWEAIEKGTDWHDCISATVIHCSESNEDVPL